METRIALFQKKEIRKTLHADELWFVIVEVVAALTDAKVTRQEVEAAVASAMSK